MAFLISGRKNVVKSPRNKSNCNTARTVVFFLSMVITNDVALITFVPLALIMLHKLPEELTEYWLIKVVVMQTIAANLGSMLILSEIHRIFIFTPRLICLLSH